MSNYEHVKNTDEDTVINETERRDLLKYRIDWQHDEGGPHPVFRSVIAYFPHADGAKELANALELVSKGYKAKAVLLGGDTAAAVVALGVTAALDDVAKLYASEGWVHKEISVNRTKQAREFCVRTLISRDLGAIEDELQKRFADVYDIATSADDEQRPEIQEELGTWPNKEGLHEWVCIVKLHHATARLEGIPETITVQLALCWFDGGDRAFKDATGKELMDATDEEAIAYAATGNARLELMAHELGGDEFKSHSELCKDGVKWIGKLWFVQLSGGRH